MNAENQSRQNYAIKFTMLKIRTLYKKHFVKKIKTKVLK